MGFCDPPVLGTTQAFLEAGLRLWSGTSHTTIAAMAQHAMLMPPGGRGHRLTAPEPGQRLTGLPRLQVCTVLEWFLVRAPPQIDIYVAARAADRYFYCGSRRRSIFLSRLAPPILGHNGLRNGIALSGDKRLRLHGLCPECLAGLVDTGSAAPRRPWHAGFAAQRGRDSCPCGLASLLSGCLGLDSTGGVPASITGFPIGIHP